MVTKRSSYDIIGEGGFFREINESDLENNNIIRFVNFTDCLWEDFDLNKYFRRYWNKSKEIMMKLIMRIKKQMSV